MVPCKFFAQGRCTYGASCRNSHEAPSAPAYSASNFRAAPAIPRQQTAVKTVLPEVRPVCWFFTQGKCTYGAACRMSHEANGHDTEPAAFHASHNSPSGHAHNPVLPKQSESLAAKILEKELAGISPVEFVPGPFQRDCSAMTALGTFGSTQLTAKYPLQTFSGLNYQDQSCIFFSRGFCRNGDTCPYRHDIQVQGPDTSEPQQSVTGVGKSLSIRSWIF